MARYALTADVAPLAAIYHSVWHETHAPFMPPEECKLRTPQFFTERMSALLATTLVAERAGSIVGFASWQDHLLSQLYVSTAHRGSGLASELITASEIEMAQAATPKWPSCTALSVTTGRGASTSACPGNMAAKYKSGCRAAVAWSAWRSGECGQLAPISASGSSASRRPSPRMLNDRTTTKMARPGEWPSRARREEALGGANIEPHDGAGRSSPSPRNEGWPRR